MKLFKLLAALALLILTTQAHAASLLPNGKQQFFNTDGTPCVGCKVYFYIPQTTTPKDTYQDSDATILNTNPVTLDSIGSAIIYGIGSYRQILQGTSGNTIWDTVTADQVSLTAAWSGLSAGSPNAQTITNSNFSLTDGSQVNFLAGLTNTGATTVNVSGTGAIPLVTDTSSGPQALGGGEITVGNVISLVYDATAGTFHIVTPTPVQSFNGAVFFNGVITPTILAANQNNWAPTGGFSGANTLRIQANTPVTVTGLAGGAAGRTVIFHNIGSNAITFAQNSSSSAAANRFLFSASVNLNPNDDMTLQYDALSSGWRLIHKRSAAPPSGLFKALKLTNGGTPNNQVIGTADAFTLIDSNGSTVTRTSLSCTADVTTSGAGGLDTGSVTTSTWYSYWFIYNSATNTDNCLFSTSAASPTLPTGYTFYARAGWNRTDGSSHFNKVTQYGRNAQYTAGTAPNLFNGVAGSNCGTASPTWTTASWANYAPSTTGEIKVEITGSYSSNTFANTQVAPSTSWGGATSTSPSPSPLAQTSSLSGWMTSASVVVETTTLAICGSGTGSAAWIIGWGDNL